MKLRDHDHARYLVARCYCECGILRVVTPSGAMCPEHRIRLGVKARELHAAERAKQLLELPVATAVPGYKTRCRFTIDSLEGEYRPCKSGEVVAVECGRPAGLRERRFASVKAKRRSSK